MILITEKSATYCLDKEWTVSVMDYVTKDDRDALLRMNYQNEVEIKAIEDKIKEIENDLPAHVEK